MSEKCDAGQARKQEDTPKRQLCGEPMPPGEEMFNYHGYSGDCPKPPLPRNPVAVGDDDYVAFCRYTERGTIVTCDSDAPKAFKVYRRREAAAQPSAPPLVINFGDWCDSKGIQPTMGMVEKYASDMVAQSRRPGLEAQPSAPLAKWISVEEELPKDGQRCLVWGPTLDAEFQPDAQMAVFDSISECWIGDMCSLKMNEVTHWMMLQPPKG